MNTDKKMKSSTLIENLNLDNKREYKPTGNTVSNDISNGIIEITEKDVDDFVDCATKVSNGINVQLSEEDAIKYTVISNILQGGSVDSMSNVKIDKGAMSKIESLNNISKPIEINDKDIDGFVDCIKRSSNGEKIELTKEEETKYGLINEIAKGNNELFGYVKISDSTLRKLQSEYKKLTQASEQNTNNSSQAVPVSQSYSGSSSLKGTITPTVDKSATGSFHGVTTKIDPDKIAGLVSVVRSKYNEEMTIINNINSEIESLKDSYKEETFDAALDTKLQYIKNALIVKLSNHNNFISHLDYVSKESSMMDQQIAASFGQFSLTRNYK